jgi:GxxExxY protein
MVLSYPELQPITHLMLKQAYTVHTALGPGLLESVYHECLYYRLVMAGLWVDKEKPMPVTFEGIQLECGYRLDLIVEHQIVLELKSVEALSDLHEAQLLTYMRLGNFRLGYLINFNVISLRDGMKRYVR